MLYLVNIEIRNDSDFLLLLDSYLLILLYTNKNVMKATQLSLCYNSNFKHSVLNCIVAPFEFT